MKKYLFIIICFFALQNNVIAEVYYGEYRKVESLNDIHEDLIKIEKYKIYNTYDKEYIDIGYMEENEEYIVDYEDYIIEERLVDYYTENDEYINIKVSKEKDFDFIFDEIPFNTKFYELEIYNNEELLTYDIYSSSIFGTTLKYLYDKDYDTYFYYQAFNYISPLLKQPYYVESLKIILYTDIDKNYQIKFNICGNAIPILLNNSIKRKHIFTFDYIEDYDKEESYEAEYKYIDKIKLYKHYKENITKTDNYQKEGKNIILDDYKEIEEYYLRDKLEIEDIIEINNNTKSIEEYIKYSSGKTNIDCNIDYNVNGVYECNFKLNDINVKKEVIVNIPQTEIKEEILDLNNENIENKKDDIKNVEQDNIEINNELENVEQDNIEINNELENIEQDNIEINKELVNVEKDNIEINNELENETYVENNKYEVLDDIEYLKIVKQSKSSEINKENYFSNTEEVSNKTELLEEYKEKVKTDKIKINKMSFIKYIIIINFIALEIILFIKKKRNRNNVE